MNVSYTTLHCLHVYNMQPSETCVQPGIDKQVAKLLVARILLQFRWAPDISSLRKSVCIEHEVHI